MTKYPIKISILLVTCMLIASIGSVQSISGLDSEQMTEKFVTAEEHMLHGEYNQAIEIFDDESGVNNAINLADEYLSDKNFDCSVIFPQDIPIMTSSDIDALLGFIRSINSVIIVPSRQFNGTNALVRYPVGLMQTRYDMVSYTHQMDAASTRTKNISIALIRRMMLDIDDESDLAFMLKQNAKPDFCNKIASCL